MILEGPPNSAKDLKSTSQIAISLSQLLKFNSVKSRRNEPIKHVRHSQELETPLPIYIGMKVHAATRKRGLVDMLHENGLSISYSRLQTLSTKMASSVSEYYRTMKCVVPPELKQNLFTTGAVDNIDHNPTSTTSKDSFHGTSILLFQHPEDKDHSSRKSGLVINPCGLTSKNICELPSFYSNIQPVNEIKTDIQLKPPIGTFKIKSESIGKFTTIQKGWLETIKIEFEKKKCSINKQISIEKSTSKNSLENKTSNSDSESDHVMVGDIFNKDIESISHKCDVDKDELFDEETCLTSNLNKVDNLQSEISIENQISWSGYHSSSLTSNVVPTISSILPLFKDVAHTEAMMKHSMEVIQDAVKYLNPGQVPVITCDQPLYALCRLIQEKYPHLGPDKYFVMMGGLHIEMVVLKILGELLSGSGWVHTLSEARVLTEGRADACLKASHIARSRYVHEVTSATIYILQSESYQKYLSNTCSEEKPSSFEEWK